MRIQSEPTIKEIAASLRAIRKQKGYTLKEVEERSDGKWKAVVVGSYERCDRSLSLNKAIALASFYQVPLDQLLGLQASSANESTTGFRTIIDLRALKALEHLEPRTTLFKGFIGALCSKRKDWNGEVISLRISDISILGFILGLTEVATRQWLIDQGLLLGLELAEIK